MERVKSSVFRSLMTASAYSNSSGERPRQPESVRILAIVHRSLDILPHALACLYRLATTAGVEVQLVINDASISELHTTAFHSRHWKLAEPEEKVKIHVRAETADADKLVRWANVLLCLPVFAGDLTEMMSGIRNPLILDIFESWYQRDRFLVIHSWQSRPILLVPGKPILKRWGARACSTDVRAASILEQRHTMPRTDPNLRSQAHEPGLEPMDLLCLHKMISYRCAYRDDTLGASSPYFRDLRRGRKTQLPMELLIMIFEYVDEWDLASFFGIPTKHELSQHIGHPLSTQRPRMCCGYSWSKSEHLAREIPRADLTTICNLIAELPLDVTCLDAMSAYCLVRYDYLEVLEYIDGHRPQLLQCPVVAEVVAQAASLFKNRVHWLDWWLCCPVISDRQSLASKSFSIAAIHNNKGASAWWKAAHHDSLEDTVPAGVKVKAQLGLRFSGKIKLTALGDRILRLEQAPKGPSGSQTHAARPRWVFGARRWNRNSALPDLPMTFLQCLFWGFLPIIVIRMVHLMYCFWVDCRQ